MVFKGLFGGPKTTIYHLELVGEGLEYEAEDESVRVWRTAVGDGVGVFYFGLPPNLPPGRPTEQDLLEYFRVESEAQGVRVIESDICDVSDFRALRSIIRAPQESGANVFVGAFTVPFRDRSFVVKIQCEEFGVTGIREAVLFDRALGEGKVEIGDEGEIVGDWNPYDAAFDTMFPDHPLTRARTWMPRIRDAIRFDEVLSTLPAFAWPPGN